MDHTPGREERGVRITTTEGVVEGKLLMSARLRTLDDLNMVSKRFLMLQSPTSCAPSWEVGRGQLAINKNSILFVEELSTPPPEGGGRFGTFTRAAMRLKLKQYEVEGFVHMPPGGQPMKRLDQDNHAFVSLTTVLITGPEDHATTPFLAVNRNFITAAQVAESEAETEFSSTEAEIER